MLYTFDCTCNTYIFITTERSTIILLSKTRVLIVWILIVISGRRIVMMHVVGIMWMVKV